jgi:hypothetical protein
MKTFIYLFFVPIVCLTSCSHNDDKVGNDINKSTFATTSLKGKRSSCSLIKKLDCTTDNTFSTSTYSISYISGDDHTLGTPTYKYYTRNGNPVTLEMHYLKKT